MRDPARIDRIVEKLRTFWRTQPDSRLCQVVQNVARLVSGSEDNFHVEDDRLESMLDTLMSHRITLSPPPMPRLESNQVLARIRGLMASKASRRIHGAMLHLNSPKDRSPSISLSQLGYTRNDRPAAGSIITLSVYVGGGWRTVSGRITGSRACLNRGYAWRKDELPGPSMRNDKRHYFVDMASVSVRREAA